MSKSKLGSITLLTCSRGRNMAVNPRWSYGITTVTWRKESYFRSTLNSLREAGFPSPRLFIDGASHLDGNAYEKEFQLPVTVRSPTIRTYGNWMLAAAELYIRDPAAHFYAIFQDDLVAYRNLRSYLDRCSYPEKGYWNLYTAMDNEALVRGKPVGWYEGAEIPRTKLKYHGMKAQAGRGAVGLVFRKDVLRLLLTAQRTVDRPMEATRGWRLVDGGIVTALNAEGYREYVHQPSLVQHTGFVSSMRNRPHPLAVTFRGADFDATNLQQEKRDLLSAED